MPDTVVQRGLSDIVGQAVRDLVSVNVVQGHVLVRVPMTLPSGSMVQVVVEEQGDGQFRVTEMGDALDEAEFSVGEEAYSSAAAEVAHAAGLRIVDGLFVLDGLSEKQIAGGIMAIARAVVRASENSLRNLRQ